MVSQTVILPAATNFAIVVLSISLFLTVWRALTGPTLPDRVVALDMLVAVAIGFIAIVAMRTGFTLYIDIAISLGLVGFLATVAFARFVLVHGRPETTGDAGKAEIAARPPAPAPRRVFGRDPRVPAACRRRA